MLITIIILSIISLRGNALFCSIYDHSQSAVKCVQNCPTGTQLVDNRCLTDQQYLKAGQVFICRGYVSSDRTLCCPPKQYIQSGQCLPCRGQIYNSGVSCCTNDHYLDLTQSTPNCIKLSTGACPSLLLSSQFKICCPSDRMYHISLGECVSPASYTCDNTRRVCCGINQKAEYVEGRYICVNACSWSGSSSSALFCQQKWCNKLNVTAISGPSQMGQEQLLALNGQCCYGLTSNNQCMITNQTCLSTFANRGWSICCPVGYFYSTSTNQCVELCQNGKVLFNSICLTSSVVLDLTSSNGRPSQTSLSSTCNGIVLPDYLPVCCPAGFYIADNRGCQYCSGNIFTVVGYQICCNSTSYFDNVNKVCIHCQGTLDSSGQQCCPQGKYISYDANGVTSCVDTCNLDNLYLGKHCCQSMTQQCTATLTSTFCNPSYFNTFACQGCPSFCGSTSQCAVSRTASCNMTCGRNQIQYQSIGCLQCDSSCLGCTMPIDSTACLSCAQGYTLVQGRCQSCDANCLTCSQYTSTCTSCKNRSEILISGKCFRSCLDLGYYLDPYKLICVKCSTSCQECTIVNTCSSCPLTTYLTTQGSCLACDTSCSSCMGSSRQCIQCASNYIKYSDGSCNMNCPGVTLNVYQNGGLCLSCHSACLTCLGHPQNCTSCLGTTSYLDSSLGINICAPCQAPCLTCTALKSCTSCTSGYYIQGTNCNVCDTSCQTCNGPSNSNCLSCFGGTNLTANGFCSSCSEGCINCNAGVCSGCSSAYVLYGSRCLTSCPSATYKNGSGCVSCDSSCAACDATNCTSCANGFNYILADKCYVSCPTNYSPSGQNCILNTKPPTPNPPTPTPNNTNNTNNTKNNTNGNGTVVTTNSGPIIDQKVLVEGNKVKLSIYFANADFLDTNISVDLVDKQGNVIPLTTTSSADRSSNKIHLSAILPPGQDLSSYSLIQTTATSSQGNSTLVSAQPSNQLLLSSLTTQSLSNLKVFGYVFSAIMLLFIVLTKIKGHFTAEQANNIILHTFNFAQVCYLFKYSTTLDNRGYFFLNGFGIAHLSFFPNFFKNLIPEFYLQVPYQQTLIPDGNLLRNAGFSFSFQLSVVGLLVVAILISFLYSRSKQLDEPVHLRKIIRLGVLLLMIGFMNELFFAFVQIIQPSTSQDEYQGFYNSNVGCAYLLIFLVPLLMLLICYHYYQTYNSDVLEHYYTLREACLFFYIYGQAVIMCLAVGKPLVGFFLILLQILWFFFNYMLYRYGSGLPLSSFSKYFVISSVICIAYMCLSLEEYLNWIAIVIVVSFAAIVLVVYCGYQLVGIYYFNLFKEEKSQ